MSSALAALIYRERRRLTLVAGLAFMAGVLFYWPSAAYLGPVHISLVTGAVYASVVGVAALVICAALPSMRFMLEAVALSRLILAFLILAEPQLRAVLLGNPLIMAVVIVLGGICISRLIHGRIEREKRSAFTLRTPWREAVVRHGNDWQRSFVHWVEGTVPVRVSA